jgi:hypothetical protein
VLLSLCPQNGYVAMEELKMLINMLYSIDAADGGPSGNTRVALQKLPVQADGKVEFWEFKLFHDAFPSLFYPAFRLQVKVYLQPVLWRCLHLRSIDRNPDALISRVCTSTKLSAQHR